VSINRNVLLKIEALNLIITMLLKIEALNLFITMCY